ncbi:unnamed protein product [Diamesa serratosioi]
MLREKRKHANYKPNRRLDAKSSRGMIYENEELRIRTININAEVERGQSEIKTLKREREQLRREIWSLRDEYDKLENLLRVKGIDPDEFLNQNKKGNDNNDELDDDCSTCISCNEENGDDGDDQSRNKNSFESNPKITTTTTAEMGQPSRLNASEDQTKTKSVEQPQSSGKPVKESRLKHFFSPIRKKAPVQQTQNAQPDIFVNNVLPNNMYVNPPQPNQYSILKKNRDSDPTTPSPTTSFQTGGNLEELLYDIETLSKDILELQTQCSKTPNESETNPKKPFRSELNLFLSCKTHLPSLIGNIYYNLLLFFLDPSSSVKQQNEIDNHVEPLVEMSPLVTRTLLPSPFPSCTIPSSPITPPSNFKINDLNLFDAAQNAYLKDSKNLSNFSSINDQLPNYPASNFPSVFCTVSAPSTPASDRKFVDKFILDTTDIDQRAKGDATDKKKLKRVSYLKDDHSEKPITELADGILSDSIPGEDKDNLAQAGAHHSHSHRNHQKPVRRMSLDNTLQQSPSSRHKNHRQVCHDPQPNRRESNRSNNSLKKRSRSDSTFGGHDEGGTSVSERERYSNSIASSRESSTSLSLKSSRRRISITSHGNSKKIPWCGCWGTGCL